ncbi:hypothetical protein KIP88_43950 [Bradyrhizobium sp. SRL28]|uniref:hypothetical protein n=1 Tax=Bradyrhizobium sp. SRL28 TaxID=2836178 RepID=UPI001BDEF77E|nr:hypothetical protein [Bradyrhizobium sp. SRL28]MBT1517281.1 hypothetical protein [Bradyrhizobium sp. SRL28]
MTEYVEMTPKPREQILKAAENELLAFERKEGEFRKRLQRERAAELPMPAIKDELLRN